MKFILGHPFCHIVGNPPSPTLLKRGRPFQKFSHLGGGGRGTKFFLERGDKPVKRGVDVKMEGVATFFITLQFSSITFSVCVCVCVWRGGGGGVRFPLLLFRS